MNALQFDLRRFAGTVAFLALSAAIPLAGIAQDQPKKPFISPSEMPHKTRMSLITVAHPDQTGRWDLLPFHMPINPVHVALMRTGKVLVISGSGNDPDNKHLQAGVWDPVGLSIKTFPIAWDMFCSGMVISPDGRPFILGGTLKYDPFLGETRTAFFDPITETFANGPDMGPAEGRWYPSGVILGDGSVMVDSGLSNIPGPGGNAPTNLSVQIWEGSTWSAGGSAFNSLQLYPRQHLLPNGLVFASGASQDSQMYDPAGKIFRFVTNTLFNHERIYGTSVLLPLTPENGFKPTVMILGGATPMTTKTTELIDLSVGTPTWVKGPDMVKPRIQMNATILPDGKVLTSGGSEKDEDPTTAVKEAQLYDPATNAFTPASSMEFPRLYHSNTMLLPDATVVSLGGNPMRKLYQSEIEIYSPPYLFNTDGSPARRPTIADATPGDVTYGRSFTVKTPDAGDIKSVVLIRPGAVTHAFDMDQRLVGLTFGVVGGDLQANAPTKGNLAPPGYYLLFVVNTKGVPSVAKFVRLSN